MISYAAFPHIVESIVHYADTPTLLVLRATSRRLRKCVDKRLARHVVLTRGLLDYARIFTTPRANWDRCTLRARETVYVLNVAPTRHCPVQLPLHPLPGGSTVRIIIRFDPSNPHLPEVIFSRAIILPDIPSKIKYEVFLVPTPQPPTGSQPWRYHNSGIHFVSGLVDVFAECFATLDASLLLVGYESVPLSFPASGSSQGDEVVTADMLDEEFVFLVKTSSNTPEERQADLANLRYQTAADYAAAHGCKTLEDMDVFDGLGGIAV
jgi:hypothetical protein